jgi:hypothetical protein
MHKTIRSRSNKNIGDLLGDCEITGKTVIAEPHPGDPYRGSPPRLGIYDYEVKAIILQEPKPNEPNVGGTRREASSVPLTVRRLS